MARVRVGWLVPSRVMSWATIPIPTRAVVVVMAGLIVLPGPPGALAAEDVQMAGHVVSVTAHDLRFEPDVIVAPASAELQVRLSNAGLQPHNIAFHVGEGGEPLGPGAIGPVIQAGESVTVTFVTPPPGEYFFVCSVHPLDMDGTLIVGEGASASPDAPSPARAAPSRGPDAPPPDAPPPADSVASPAMAMASPAPDGATADPPRLVLADHPRIDPGAFRVTTFAAGLPFTTAMQALDDGSLLVAINEPQGGGFLRSTGKLVRMVDEDDDGVADRYEPIGVVGPVLGGGLDVYQDLPGAIVQMRRHSDLLFVTSRRDVRSSISILRAPSAPSGAYQLLDALDLSFPEEHLHDTYALAVRDGSEGSIEIYFNVGSRLEGASDPTLVEVRGFVRAELEPESVYRMELRDDGQSIVPGRLELVATGLRNAAGMAFDPRSGALYLQDNGMSREDDPDESLSADELNVIPVGRLDGDVTDFGWSEAWTAYRSGETVGQRGEAPLVAFQPVEGAESEGAAEIAFAPRGFPAGLDDGLFVGFHGVYSAAGIENEENPLVYVDLEAGTYFHFVPNDVAGIGHLDNLLATEDSLFVADLNREGTLGTMRPDGVIYQIKALASDP